MCQGWGHGDEDLPKEGKTEALCSTVWEVQLRGEADSTVTQFTPVCFRAL